MVARATKRKTRPEPPRASSASTGTRKRRKTRALTDDEDGDNGPMSEGGDNGADAFEARPHAAVAHALNEAQCDVMRAALLEWYASAQDVRGMPWRKRWDETLAPAARTERAYEVWVSEIMLQQTQVATVVPYYTRWMERFPTVQALAEATIDDVNALWKGLGYYSRAARLLAGAQAVVKDFQGQIPCDPAVLQKSIPGIGRYSAGAITSIAYGVCAPVLDGNVHRLLSRVLALHAPPQAKATLSLLWAAATELVRDASIPGDVNQALIELGSTVCKPRAPSQSSDDIEDLCNAKVRKKAREETDVACVVYWDEHVLLRRRPAKGLLGGLYEFPTAPAGTEACDVIAACVTHPVCKKALSEGEDEVEVEGRDEDDSAVVVEQETRVGDVVHVFSHIHQTWQVVVVRLAPAGATPPRTKKDCTWVRAADVAGQNLGTGTLKQWHLATTRTVGGRTRGVSGAVEGE